MKQIIDFCTYFCTAEINMIRRNSFAPQRSLNELHIDITITTQWRLTSHKMDLRYVSFTLQQHLPPLHADAFSVVQRNSPTIRLQRSKRSIATEFVDFFFLIWCSWIHRTRSVTLTSIYLPPFICNARWIIKNVGHIMGRLLKGRGLGVSFRL